MKLTVNNFIHHFILHNLIDTPIKCLYLNICINGWVAERLKAPVLKTGKGESPSWVRIPPHPPYQQNPYIF